MAMPMAMRPRAVWELLPKYFTFSGCFRLYKIFKYRVFCHFWTLTFHVLNSMRPRRLGLSEKCCPNISLYFSGRFIQNNSNARYFAGILYSNFSCVELNAPSGCLGSAAQIFHSISVVALYTIIQVLSILDSCVNLDAPSVCLGSAAQIFHISCRVRLYFI